MRRLFAATVVAVATAIAALPALPTSAATDEAPVARPFVADQSALRALTVAARVLDGQAAAGDPDATIALRDLRLALPRLTGLDRQRAQALLARPTDGNRDRFNDGYTTKSTKKKCSKYVCVHWVTKTVDKPPSGWAGTTLTQMNRVWKKEIGGLGYRKPLGDGSKGGNAKLDIYLKDVGSKFLYGYCAAEKKQYKYTYSGYCVLDDDFDPGQFGGAPAINSLKVTAAHEFFHAVQYAYDAAEDPWFMESTATWMEERYADSVNDNRQYFSAGQIDDSTESLDTWINGGGSQYANWIVWEYLTQRKGNSLVKNVWKQAATYRGAPDKYSIRALADVLKNKGGFKSTFAAYSAGLTDPGSFWDEGAEWGVSAPIGATHNLSTTTTSGSATVGINHLASRTARFVPTSSLTGSTWKLKVKVDGPGRVSSPVAYVLVHKKDGSLSKAAIPLNKDGVGTKTVSFDFTTVANVTVAMGNASTRYRCWVSSATYSCYGIPKDESKPFKYTGTAIQQ